MLDCTNNLTSINVCEDQTIILILSTAVFGFRGNEKKAAICAVIIIQSEENTKAKSVTDTGYA